MTIPSPPETQSPPPRPSRLVQVLGPGLITGASDDDPSGIATYSHVGAAYGYALGWTLLLTFPLMSAIQEICARIGRVTGHGIAGNLRRHFPQPVLYVLVGLLCVANVINLGADLGAMAAALRLLIGGPALLYVALFAGASIALQVFMSYQRYVKVLRWLTISLFAYVASVLVIGVPWKEMLHQLVVPHITWNHDYLMAIVAVFGTTISPYLFFWQAEQEVEDERENPATHPLRRTPLEAPAEFARIRLDTAIGMAFSNIVALCIMVTAAATLHAHGVTEINDAADAAEALRPIAGPLAFAVFALGIIGTGLLALPVLAGSTAYAVGEALRWPVGLARKPHEARAFYATIALAMIVGAAMNVAHIEPMKALVWAAFVNGVVAVPIMVMTMVIAGKHKAMGQFRIRGGLRFLGWAATAVMAASVVALFAL